VRARGLSMQEGKLTPNPLMTQEFLSVPPHAATTPAGLGLRNAVVTIIDPAGVRRNATTSSFGLYSFDNIVPGQTYILTVASKRFRFTPLMMPINGSLTSVDFAGLE